MITADQAHDHIFQNVYAPVFFQKLSAEYGVVPQNQEHADALLRMAAKLRNAHDSGVVKQAAAGNYDAIARAEALLDSTLNKVAGVDPMEQEIQRAAQQLSASPQMVEAVITFQNAVAARV